MIVPMSRVEVLGLRRLLPEVIAFLQRQGVLELRPTAGEEPVRGRRPPWVRPVPLTPVDRDAERAIEAAARRLDDLLPLLPDVPAVAEEALPSPDVAGPEFAGWLESVGSEVHSLTGRRVALEEERALTARYERVLIALASLRPDLNGAENHVETLGLLVAKSRPEAIPLIEREVDRITQGAFSLAFREVDTEHLAVLLAVPRAAAREVSRLLFERGIGEVRLPERYAGRPLPDALALLVRRARELPEEAAAVEAELTRAARRLRAPLAAARREADDRLARLRAIARCGETEHAFVIAGWVPAERVAALVAAVEAAFERRVALFAYPIEAAEWEEVPVLLDNPPALRPFELLLAFVPLPRYGSIDPTPYLAVFFPLFFGVMLGDVALGGIALLLALAAASRGWGGRLGRQLAVVAAACSVSAIVFGFLFGEFLGELGPYVGLHPLLFDRRHAALATLGLALGLGAAHVLLGMAIGVWLAVRHGHARAAVGKGAALLLVVAAIATILGRLGYVPPALDRAALVAAGPLLALAIAAEGLKAPLELLTTLGNILSYARLMALGIASVTLAEVANRIAGAGGPPALGLAAAALLHGVNFAMGLFSPSIQALRLHYVEFFDKFYEAGGRPYRPLSLSS